MSEKCSVSSAFSLFYSTLHVTKLRTLVTVQCEEKNIRRRVYDALNVLIAMKIIHKDGKSIRWTGMPATVKEQCRKLEVSFTRLTAS